MQQLHTMDAKSMFLHWQSFIAWIWQVLLSKGTYSALSLYILPVNVFSWIWSHDLGIVSTMLNQLCCWKTTGTLCYYDNTFKSSMYSDIHLFESNIYSTNIPSQYRRYLISTSFICNTKAWHGLFLCCSLWCHSSHHAQYGWLVSK